jgi:ribose transport system permease protein
MTSDNTAETAERAPTSGTVRLRLAARMSAFIPYFLVPCLFLLTGAVIPGYISFTSARSVLVLGSMLGIASVGQTLTILIGGIDLSIPAVIGLADVVLTQLYGHGWSFWVVAFLILAMATAIGVANALIARLLQVPSLVVTLAMGSIILGGVLAWTHAENTGTVPDWLVNMVSVVGTTGPIPIPGVVVAWVVISVLIIGFQRSTWLGRHVYAVGANPIAARLALVHSMLVWSAVFALSAILAAIAGIFLAGFSSTSDVGVGQPYLFMTIAAVVIGGTSLLGGRGGYGRTIAGTLVITELTTLLIGVGFSEAMQEMALGILIVVLVLLYGREPHVSMRI